MRSISSWWSVCGVVLLSVSCAAAAEKIKIEHSQGFHTLGPANAFPEVWSSCKERHKLQGKVSDHLTREEIDTIVMLEVHIAIAMDPKSPGLADELLRFMKDGNEFETGPLPDRFIKHPQKQLVALFRTRQGTYGLITLYRDLAVIELQGRIGVAPAIID